MRYLIVFIMIILAINNCALIAVINNQQVCYDIDIADEAPALVVFSEEALASFIVDLDLETGEELPENTAVSPPVLLDLMKEKGDEFAKILDDISQYEIQILLTQVNRNSDGKPSFISEEYGMDTNKYFYPASAVKMAIAALTLQKLHSIAKADRTCVLNAAKSKNGSVGRAGFTIEKYIYRMIVYSDNIAYNRLYDFLGQQYINETLHNMEYIDCQIIRRYDSQLSAKEDRNNYPWELRDNEGELLDSSPAITNENIYSLRERKDMTGLLRGRARMTAKGLISSPKEFYDYNYMSLEVMQNILKALVFPAEVEKKARFDISADDREFLLACLLGEGTEHKYFIYGGAGLVNPDIEIYNKTGTSYGNIIDNAYIIDKTHNIEFFLTAVIYVNPNGIIGDEIYDYEKTGLPFLQNLGLAIYEYYLRANE
ncbi:MAG: class A beta-lactamase-related serine hydrolase [Firmicutes bacterium]|nr:class A beta-lactamase-related serine hydrolase [Bacillota bacterium]